MNIWNIILNNIIPFLNVFEISDFGAIMAHQRSFNLILIYLKPSESISYFNCSYFKNHL